MMISRGKPGRGLVVGPGLLTRQVIGDADCGDGCPDPARALYQRQDDQGNRPRPEGVAEHAMSYWARRRQS
jgi:hypothetical protein